MAPWQNKHPSKKAALGAADVKYPEVDPAAIEKLLSRELQQLSFHDRNAIHEEIHGVRNNAPEETPGMVEGMLWQLGVELQQIRSKPAFDRAQALPRTYVNDPDFRVRFLRADLWNPQKAAQRIVSFLDLVLEYYGVEALERPIRLSDLNENEIKILKSGQIQLLPFRDRSGRRVLAMVSDMGFNFATDEKFKVMIYIMWVATSDEETQIKGMVVLMWPGGNAAKTFLRLPDQIEGRMFKRMLISIPSRPVAAHLCFPDTPIFQMVKALTMHWAGTANRTRTRCYSGTHVEMRYQLKGFGIPVDVIPLTDSGTVKVKPMLQWLKLRRTIEEASSSSLCGVAVECPLSSDVLFKSGSNSLSHPGNVMFRNLIETHFDEHNNTSSSGLKVAVSWRIVDEVLVTFNGRFLEWDKRGWWMVIEDRAQMRAKVATSLRDFKKQVKAVQNRQTLVNSTFEFERLDGRKQKRVKYDGDRTGCGSCM